MSFFQRTLHFHDGNIGLFLFRALHLLFLYLYSRATLLRDQVSTAMFHLFKPRSSIHGTPGHTSYNLYLLRRYLADPTLVLQFPFQRNKPALKYVVKPSRRSPWKRSEKR